MKPQVEAPRSPPPAPRVDVVVVLYNCADLIGRSLAALRLASAETPRLWLVDNRPADGSLEAALAVWPDAEVVTPPSNVGFAGGVNAALPAGTAPFVLLLNPDAELLPRALDVLVARLEAEPDVAGVGPLVLSEDGAHIDSTGLEVLATGWARDRLRGEPSTAAPPSGDVDALSGSVLLLRRAALRDIGREAEPFWGRFFMYNEDVELGTALRRGGYRLSYVAEARAHHRGGGTSTSASSASLHAARNRVITALLHATLEDAVDPRFLLRWGRRLVLDSPRLFGSLRDAEGRAAWRAMLAELPARRARQRSLDARRRA